MSSLDWPPIAPLRANAIMALGHIGPVHELTGDAIFDPVFRRAEFFLHASNAEVSVNVVVLDIGGGRFRFTLHIPNQEAAEGIVPSFWAMLKSIRVVAPRDAALDQGVPSATSPSSAASPAGAARS